MYTNQRGSLWDKKKQQSFENSAAGIITSPSNVIILDKFVLSAGGKWY